MGNVSIDDNKFQLTLPTTQASIEPRFGTRFWVEDVDERYLSYWQQQLDSALEDVNVEKPESKSTKSGLTLPRQNPYIASDFSIFPFEPKDACHPLLGAAIKMHTKVGRKWKWLLGFVVQYDSRENAVKVAFDFESSWHTVQDEMSWNDTLRKNAIAKPKDSERLFYLDEGKTKCRLLSGGIGGAQQFTLETIWELCESNTPLAPCFSPKISKFSNDVFKLWYLRDRIFLLPRAEIYISLVFKGRYGSCSARNTVLSDLMIKMVREALNDEVYMASMAEYDCTLSTTAYGVKFHFAGFNQNILKLVEKSLDEFFGAVFDDEDVAALQDRFSRVKESMKRSYANLGLKASSYAKRTRLECLQPNTWSRDDLMNALDEVNETADLRQFVVDLLANSMFLDGYAHGNLCEPDTKRLRGIIEKVLVKHRVKILPRARCPPIKVLSIPNGRTVLINRDSVDLQERNNCVEAYYEIGESSLQNKVVIDLIEHIMEEPLYDELRTNQQLGYHVSCSVRQNENILAFVVKVVSASCHVKDIFARINEFLRMFFSESLLILKKNKEKFKEHVKCLAELKLADCMNMEEETDLHWSEIFYGDNVFHRHTIEAIALKHVTATKLIEAYENWLHPDSKALKRLLIFIHGQGNDTKSELKDTDAEKAVEKILENAFNIKEPKEDLHRGAFPYSTFIKKA